MVKVINKASLTCHEKCVMCITGWVLLWLEQRIKIPKWTFHKVVCRHLSKPENKIIIIIIIINSYSFNQWVIFLLLKYLMVLWIKSIADGNASLGFPKGILHSSAIFKNSVWASSRHEQKKFRFRNEDPEVRVKTESDHTRPRPRPHCFAQKITWRRRFAPCKNDCFAVYSTDSHTRTE